MQRNLTIHTAVEYLDMFFSILTKDSNKFSLLLNGDYRDSLLNLINNPSKEDASETDLNIWAIVSLILASKYDEIDKRIPYYSEVIKASSRAAIFSLNDFHKAEEFFIKSVLNWDFRIVTTLHFTYSLISQGILFEDDKFPSSQDRILKSLRRKAELFTDLSLDSDQLSYDSYSKSKIGVSCIVAARKICEVKPLWNNKLYNMTGYHFFDIKDILEILIREYCSFFNEEYSQIMQKGESKRSKMQQRPQSFINRRASEKPKLYGQLTHIQSAKSLKLSNGIEISTIRNTLCENLTNSSHNLINFSGNNCDLKSVKLDACEGDSFTSNFSIPDENETNSGTSKDFGKVNEKCKCLSGNSESEELEPIKIYIMKFKSKNDHEIKINSYMSNPLAKSKVLNLVKSQNQIQYRKSKCIVKPFEKLNKRESAKFKDIYEASNNSKSSCRARRVHDSIYNSNSKIISSKTRPNKCSLGLSRDVLKLLRKSMKSCENSSLNETVKIGEGHFFAYHCTSPRLVKDSSSNYLYQKRNRNNFKNIKRLVSHSSSRYYSNIRQPNISCNKQQSSLHKAQFSLMNHRLVTEKNELNYASLKLFGDEISRGSNCDNNKNSCISKDIKSKSRKNSKEETYFYKAKQQLSKYIDLQTLSQASK